MGNRLTHWKQFCGDRLLVNTLVLLDLQFRVEQLTISQSNMVYYQDREKVFMILPNPRKVNGVLQV